MLITSPKLNQVYSNQEIAHLFKCAKPGGMRCSLRINTLVIISDRTKLYDDKWEDDILKY